MNKSKNDSEYIQKILTSLKFIRISDVFVIPERKMSIGKNQEFHNYYSLRFKSNSNSKIYYLRGIGTNFCITPVRLLKQKEIAVFSIGKGIYKSKEEIIILGEFFSKNIELIQEKNEELEKKLIQIPFIEYDIAVVEEYGKYWIKIWIMLR